MRLLRLAWRNLWRNRRRTIITMITITFGFALAIFAIGFGDGAHNQMIRSAISMGDGHLTIQPRGYLESPANGKVLADGGRLARDIGSATPGAGISPRITLQVLVSTAANSVGSAMQGLDVAADPHAEDFQEKVVRGEWLKANDDRGVAIGHRMAEKLKAKIGSKLVVMAGTDAGQVESRLARVRAIFKTGLMELDSFVVVGSLEFARHLLHPETYARGQEPATLLAVYLEREDDQDRVKNRIKSLELPANAVVLDWQEVMPQVVNFVIADDIGNYIWLVFILIMVAFGILNTILMSALERTREFGLLRALGLGGGHLLALVLIETVLLALISVAAGWLVGGSLHLYYAANGLDLSAMYPEGLETSGMFMEPIVYSELSWGRVLALSAIVFGTTFLSGIYPAIKASRVPPVAALQT